MMNFIEELESAWDIDGFLWHLRQGRFDTDEASRFLDLLKRIELPKDEPIPKRVVSLLWYLPSFLWWQRTRVAGNALDVGAYDRFSTEVHNTLEVILGTP